MSENKELADVTFGAVTVRPMSNDVVIGKKVVKLTPRQSEVLAVLARAQGKPVSKNIIGRAIWNEANRRDKSASPDRNILIWICYIRKALRGTFASIETIHQWDIPVHARGMAPCGYRLVVGHD